MKATPVKVKPWRHSATSKFVVTWTTGGRPTNVQIAEWEIRHPQAREQDKERFAEGNWKRHRQFFPNKKTADSFAEAQRTKLTNEGTRGLALPDDIRIQAAKCAEKLKPFGFSLEHAVDRFIEQLQLTRRSVTVKALVEEYKAAKLQKGNRERSLRDIAHRLKVFEAAFGERIVSTVTTAEIDDWITSLEKSAQSQNNYRAVVMAFFSHAVRRDYALSNPVVKIEKVRVEDKPPAIFKPTELARLLNAATPDLLPALVIGAFAGLRHAEILRLDWAEVDLSRGFIEVTARKSKTAQRRLVTMQPNLREWLQPSAGSTGHVWPYGESFWRTRLWAIMENAGLTTWPDNGLRHSFGSYHLARFSNANALALEMGHTTTKEIFAHYRELVLPEDAERYWNIRPLAAANLVPMEAAAS